MRTYLILREKVQRFHDDAEIQAALEVAKVNELRQPTFKGKVTADTIAALRRDAFAVDLEALAEQGYGHERLDQLVTELLLGVREGGPWKAPTSFGGRAAGDGRRFIDAGDEGRGAWRRRRPARRLRPLASPAHV